VIGIGSFETMVRRDGEPPFRIKRHSQGLIDSSGSHRFRQAFDRWLPRPAHTTANIDTFVPANKMVSAE
jgi:hypothetical protein